MSLNNDCSLFVRLPLLNQRLQSLDPFQVIDPADTFFEISESPLLFSEAGHDNINERYDFDGDDEYVLDEERNAFDTIMNQNPIKHAKVIYIFVKTCKSF